MTTSRRLALDHGRQFEQIALVYLQERGLTLVEKNFRFRTGEIDLIMRDRDTVIFVEVRSRLSPDFMHPLESIGPSKVRKLLNTGRAYLQRAAADVQQFRFDVVTVTGTGDDPEIDWVTDAFRE